MPAAIIDGLKVHYHVQGSGPHLLTLAPGGFNSTIERWTGGGVWKEMDAINTLSKTFTVAAYDRREAGLSGGRVEKLTWRNIPTSAYKAAPRCMATPCRQAQAESNSCISRRLR